MKSEVNLFGGKQVNAFCMPGGKIALFYGLLDRLQAGDDEVAMVIEPRDLATLREHARERVGKDGGDARRDRDQLGAAPASAAAGATCRHGRAAGHASSSARDDEDRGRPVGMELAARAGFRPALGHHAVEQDSRSDKAAAQWPDRRPTSGFADQDIEAALPLVMPLY